tara:strand:+ start:125 stop:592 length:468 start_codon:yes stop_codon:yes gene_type:complete
MELKITSNFSFVKAIKHIMKDASFGKVIDEHITKPIIEDSKEKISGDFVTPPTLAKTLRKRRARKFPPTISDSTLYDTGKLHDSIRFSDKKSVQSSILLKDAKQIEMEEYGKYHQLGSPPNKKREFIDLTVKNTEKASLEITKRIVRAMKKRLPK